MNVCLERKKRTSIALGSGVVEMEDMAGGEEEVARDDMLNVGGCVYPVQC